MSTKTTDSDRFLKGDRVFVTGLKTRKELNGKYGSVVGYLTDSYRFEVKIDGHSTSLKIKPANLLPARKTTDDDLFQSGERRVTVTGVKRRPELNGESGSVKGVSYNPGSLFVLIDGHSECVSVKTENLLPETCSYESDPDDFEYSNCDDDVNLVKAYRKIADQMKEIEVLKRERYEAFRELVEMKYSMKKEKLLVIERCEKLEQQVKEAEKKARIAVMKKRDAEILCERFSQGGVARIEELEKEARQLKGEALNATREAEKATKKLEEANLKSNTAVKAEIERGIQVAKKKARIAERKADQRAEDAKLAAEKYADEIAKVKEEAYKVVDELETEAKELKAIQKSSQQKYKEAQRKIVKLEKDLKSRNMKQESQPPGVLVVGTERETADRVEKATEGLVDAVKFVSDQMNDVTVQIEEFNRKLEDSRRVMVSKVSVGRRSRSITFDDKIRINDITKLQVQVDGAEMRNLEPKNYSQR